MKLTNRDMDIYINALSKISDNVTGKLAYAVARNIRKLSNELVEYQNMNNKTIEKYGTKNDKGTYSIRVDSEEYLKYLEEMQDVQDLEYEIDIQTVSEDIIENSNLNAQEILSIDFMIAEEKNG